MLPVKVLALFDRRPILVAVAGPNGAGKTTFYHAHLQPVGLSLVNADVLAAAIGMDAYEAAKLASSIRESLVEQSESFVFETVFSDPVGDKISFLLRAAQRGYTVALCFIGISSFEVSLERVSMRVSKGGHNVPVKKLVSRYPRILANLGRAITSLPNVLIFDNDNLETPFRLVGIYSAGEVKMLDPPIPEWLAHLIPA